VIAVARNVKQRNALQGMIAAQILAAVQQFARLNWRATVDHLLAESLIGYGQKS